MSKILYYDAKYRKISLDTTQNILISAKHVPNLESYHWSENLMQEKPNY
jgi:hypothetical protein